MAEPVHHEEVKELIAEHKHEEDKDLVSEQSHHEEVKAVKELIAEHNQHEEVKKLLAEHDQLVVKKQSEDLLDDHNSSTASEHESEKKPVSIGELLNEKKSGDTIDSFLSGNKLQKIQ